MPAVTAFQTNMSAGEISPKLFARVDISKWPNALYECQNFVIQRFGGAKKRGGTQFINEVRVSSNATRLIPFIFSVTQAYILEFSNLRIRIYTNGGVVESGGSPVEVVSPYTSAQVFELQFAQSADVLYIVHPDHAPMEFTRTSATTFTLDEMEFKDGPYLELNETGTTLTPASTGHATPDMTSNNAPSGTVSGATDAWQIFDREKTQNVGISASDSGAITHDLGVGVSKVVDAYWITSAKSNSSNADMPSEWEIEGSNDGSTFVALDNRVSEDGWGNTETRFYEFNNTTAYRYYRWSFRGSGDTNSSRAAELALHERAENQTPFNLTASSTTGVNGGQGFLTSDVGRAIRLLGSDGKWRWARIAARTSSTVVTIRLYGHALPTLAPIVNWQMGAWSDETGWPASVGFFSGRLCFARTANQPQTVWMSVVDDFNNFGISDPLQDDDAITATIASDSLNEIKWIAEGTDLFVGTTAAIRTIGATTSTSAFSPTNIRQKRETNYGASDVQPVRVGQTALYSGYYRKDIREIAYSFEFNGYVSTDLSILSEHIPNRVKQIAYAQSPESIVWGVTDDGALFGMTYERDQEVIAFHEHVLGGANSVESVATIPGSEGDETWLIVNRTIGGGTKRYIERLSEGLPDDQPFPSASTFLDCHLTYLGSSTTTLTGLSHLNGESVYVWGGSGSGPSKQGPFTVTAGSITLTSAVTTACVGYPYTSALETLSPEAAARGGTAQTRLGRISEVFLRLNRSMNGKCGPHDGNLETLDYTKGTDNEGNYGTTINPYTGDVRVPISMDWNRQKRIRVEHSEPSPFHVLGLITEIRVSG